MPCYLVQIARVDIGNVEADHLQEALKALGLAVNRRGNALDFTGTIEPTGAYVRGTFVQGGKLQLRDVAEADAAQFVNPIKRQLSAQAIKAAASKFRFDVRKTAANKFVATKRRA